MSRFQISPAGTPSTRDDALRLPGAAVVRLLVGSCRVAAHWGFGPSPG